MNDSVFELCDTTSDEMYFPLGVFKTLDDVEKAITLASDKGHSISEFAEDYEILEVRERKYGWSGSGSLRLKVEREIYYNEDTDEYLWRMK